VPSTTDTIVKDILEAASGKRVGEFGLTMNPEFLREGKAVADFMNPDRIVIGAYDDKSFAVMKEVYAGFAVPIIQVNLRTAEMIKYTANALLATLISYSNEIASLCEATGEIDAKEVLAAVCLDKRFNPRVENNLVNPEMINYLQAGCGFGGSCFPKDVKALISFGRDRGCLPRIISATMKVNEEQPQRILSKLEGKFGSLAGKKVAVLGLAFKPGTDDIRESPSIAFITGLLARGARVWGTDPIALENMRQAIPQVDGEIEYTKDYKRALQGADAALLVTPWPELISISPERYVQLMGFPLVVDCRRVLDKEILERAGAIYLGVGLV
jgi:UDPglucose 6-dehydrogenase/GDP-mannose 6-dehydrogenase